MTSGKPKVVPVSELFDRLVSEPPGVGLPHSVLFQAALRVCAEDSKRVQRGEEPSQVWTLVQRAREVLAASHPGAFPAAASSWVPSQDGESSGIRFSGLKPPTPASEPEAAARADDAAIDFQPAEPEAPLAEPVRFSGAPTGVEPVPEEPSADGIGPWPEPAAAPEAPPPSLPEAWAPEPAEDAAPGRGPEAVSPVLQLRHSTVSFQDLFTEESGGEPGPDVGEGGEGRSLLFRVAVVALAILATAVAVVILWPGIAPRRQGPARIVESFPAPRPASVPTAAATAAPAAPTAAPTPRLTAPAAPQVPPARAAQAPPPGRPARPAEVEGVETMRSSDWAGHQPTFVVHFASYKSRDNALSDAARLGNELGRPAHALAVDLGDRGLWYRVVVGDFASVADARAFRAEVAARKTGEVGGVYRLAAP